MANLLPVPQQVQILSLHQKGFSNRRIARELGVNRRSVARYIQGLSKCTISSTGSEPISLALEEPVLPAPEPKCTTLSNILAPGRDGAVCVRSLRASFGRRRCLGWGFSASIRIFRKRFNLVAPTSRYAAFWRSSRRRIRPKPILRSGSGESKLNPARKLKSTFARARRCRIPRRGSRNPPGCFG